MTDSVSISRRRLLKQMAAAGLVYGCGLGVVRALAADMGAAGQRLHRVLGADIEKIFMELSVALTGYQSLDRSLVPAFLENINAAELWALLKKFEALPPPRNTAQVTQILKGDERLMRVAQVITLFWYTGAVMITSDDNKLYDIPAYRPVSSAAYLEGVAWDAMKAHPMGQCGSGPYGYWAVEA